MLKATISINIYISINKNTETRVFITYTYRTFYPKIIESHSVPINITN